MTAWRPQLYERHGHDAGVDPIVLDHALDTAEQLRAISPDLPPVFTLAHLSHQSGVSYVSLRNIVERSHDEPYRVFRIRKRAAHPNEHRYRHIAVPSTALMKTQRWITQAILSKVRPHPSSVAFSKGDTLVTAAAPHCGCRWLIKMDVRNFFESINEIAVFRVFLSLGYQPLISFEMARICTRLAGWSIRRSTDRWDVHSWSSEGHRWSEIKAYQAYRPDIGPLLGHLPQGAPTSPMLANLAMRDFDDGASKIARKHGLIYTRYADDLTFSASDYDFTDTQCRRVIGQVYRLMGKVGLSPNVTKTRVAPPGSRKIVLGLLVDGERPRLTREFRALMRQHLYYIQRPDIGPVQHAKTRGFVSVAGFRNHLYGLVAFARQIDLAYGEACMRALNKVSWPV